MGEWFKFLGVSLLFIVVSYVGARGTLESSQRHCHLVVHVIVLGFWALSTMMWVWLITAERGKELFRTSYVNGILWPPFVYSITLLVISAPVFASISVLLQQYGLATFEPRLPEQLSSVVDLYIWHFLDSVPGLEIPQTLKWAQPYQYSDRLSGVVLLVFKITVIVPVIASFVLWRGVRESAVAARARALNNSSMDSQTASDG